MAGFGGELVLVVGVDELFVELDATSSCDEEDVELTLELFEIVEDGGAEELVVVGASDGELLVDVSTVAVTSVSSDGRLAPGGMVIGSTYSYV